ncbi:integrase core domain-containing protein [Cereibacter azotoformans]|uniref:integrase core domain-containing protein n=1 Tax=Cereibacter azotoformans TaxID=43057 RepID=UPI003CC82B0A
MDARDREASAPPSRGCCVIELYNTRRPHSSLGYRPPAPRAVQWTASPPAPATPATPTVAPRPVMH